MNQETVISLPDARVAARHVQLTTQIRDKILQGEFRPGTVLPSMHELARQFDTSYFTVQTALTPLVKEGLLARKRRVGTVVKYNASILTSAGIYCADVLDGPDYDFYRVLIRQLKQQLAAHNVRTELFMDSRPHEEHKLPLPALVRAITKREIQALIVTLGDEFTVNWLPGLPVASSFAGGVGRINLVSYDSAEMLRLALTQLKTRGCRTVGLISTVEKALGQNVKFHADFMAIAAELGLQSRNAWVGGPEEYSRDKVREGYNQFHTLWKQAERPDGLVVFPDVAARGVTTAVLELGVRVPDDLKMVFHHNTEVDWICPLAVDYVETDTAAWAAALIEQVRQLKAGKEATTVMLSYRVVTAEAKR